MLPPLLVANWKMNLGPEEGLALFRYIRQHTRTGDGLEVVVCPSFVTLPVLASVRAPFSAPVALGAQDCHWAEQGAYTGEVSAPMLRGLCEWVILGHSERRTMQGESNALIHKKLHAALDAGLQAILCVGEDLVTREAAKTSEWVREQLLESLGDLPAPQIRDRITIAYEPVWAIGSGQAASPAEANRVAGLIVRRALADRYGENVARNVRVLYGGSVDASNIGAFLQMPEIDGALVGGASLDGKRFVALMEAARSTTKARPSRTS